MLERTKVIAYWSSVGIDPDRCYYTGWPLEGVFEADHLVLPRGGRRDLAPKCLQRSMSSGTRPRDYK